jgi:hypothetical protein
MHINASNSIFLHGLQKAFMAFWAKRDMHTDGRQIYPIGFREHEKKKAQLSPKQTGAYKCSDDLIHYSFCIVISCLFYSHAAVRRLQTTFPKQMMCHSSMLCHTHSGFDHRVY